MKKIIQIAWTHFNGTPNLFALTDEWELYKLSNIWSMAQEWKKLPPIPNSTNE